MRRTLRLLLVLGLAGCGGASSTPTTVAEPAPTTATAEPGPEAAPASPWASITDEELIDRVRAGAVARIREADPQLAIDGFQAWRRDPASAPPLGDRVCEQMLYLAAADFAAGDLEGAAQTVRLVRAKARNRNMAYVGTTLLSVIARRSAGEDPAAQRTAVEAVLNELPRARFGASTVVFQLYQERTQIDASLEQTRQQLLTLETAASYLFTSHVLADAVANRPVYLEAITNVRTAHDARPADRDYRFSTVDLARARDAQPVLVGVWDTGTAGDLFPQQLFTNPNEQPNGQDDDGNGLVDDVHGVVSDPDAAQTGLTYDPGAEVITQYAPFLRGVMDLRAGMASTEAAQRVLTLMRGATDAASLEVLESNLDAVGEWAHGTHVAGILVQGLPQARVAVFRSAWAGETRVYRHRGPTDAELAAERANVEAIADFINTHHVRVVNASLGFAQDYLEAELGHESSVYTSDEQVRRRAAEIHARRRANWQWIFEHCPETLFVIAAGNSNRDVVEYGDVPASIQSPNVLVVGAVDRFGNWATFTNSSPDRVRLFDFGVEVDSLIPNGEHVPLSGTSMASPNAANLAAKMISVDPALTPARTIEIMLGTGDAIAAPFGGVIANEERALQRVRRERPRAGRVASAR
ncbi:S8 family serine peptidase [Sandaracinus amylolyticus]|uniref:Serine protease, subtilase family n=1 Tax=Sandaracinus amylolyticus TaxID=927083 RepID=A0A0F6W149_9BACT|nr:S8 family serine peptidase [Sandaracinus amylolyticus]AKF04615.1 Serine protease, subtilase family [Sandaracinus amylolyticus]